MLQEIIKEVLQRKGKLFRSKTQIHIKKGSVKEEINEGKKSLFLSPLF